METDKICIWCDKPFYCGDFIVELKNCDHVIHEDCIEQWFRRIYLNYDECYKDREFPYYPHCPGCDEWLQNLDPCISTVYRCPKSFDADHDEDNCREESDDNCSE